MEEAIYVLDMRVASKVFLATALVMLVLVGIAAWSLRAVDSYVRANQGIIARTVPALRLEASLRETMPALVRLQTRYAVLGDPGYQALWSARAERAARDLERLGPLLTTLDEARLHRKSLLAFTAYRRIAPVERTAGGAVPDPSAARTAAAHTVVALDRLTNATYAALEHSQDDARRLGVRTRRAVSAALPVALLAGVIGAALVALGMTRSLRRLTTAAGEIAQGSFAGPVRVSSHDEIGELADAFNRMAERLGELDRMKEEFFAHISHELRTPLTAAREATGLLREEVPGPLSPKQARLVDIVRASCERMLALVDRILELSRIEAGLLALERRRVDVDGIVARALEELRPQAEARGLVLERNGSRPAGEVLGDEERLLQVLVNLLGNAIKFTPSGGAVRVRTADLGEEIEIAVEDTGVGIPPDALPRVFDRYWQAPGSQGGSGLGLAIVKGIVQAHGGAVEADSREGAGSRFSVRLPRGGVTA